MTTPVVLDTDIGGDVDDALALALCVRHPEIDLRAVTTVSGDPARRARIAARVLRLAGRDDIEVAAGLSTTLPPGQPDRFVEASEAALDDDPIDISDRDGVDLLRELAAEPTTTVCTIGPLTNLAELRSAGRLVVMGGAFGPLEAHGQRFDAGVDYNLQADVDSSVRGLTACPPAVYVPCDVTFRTALTDAHVDRLRKGDPLCQALARLVDAWSPAFHRLHAGAPADHRAMMHDPLAVAVIVDGSFTTVEPLPVTVTEHEGKTRTFIDPVDGVLCDVVRSVDAKAFADWWLDVVLSNDN